MSETALALVQSITAVEFFKPGASKDLLDKVKQEARELAASFDVSTPAGEDGIRTLAAKLGKVKNKIENEGKALVAGEKSRLKVIDTERGVVWDEMEALQKEVRQPLTDKENAEKARIDSHEAALDGLIVAGNFVAQNWQTMPIEDMRARLAAITNSRRDWQEFLARAKQTVVTAIGQIKTSIAQREKMDADAAELEQLRTMEIARQKKEAEEDIARKAREAAEAVARKREEEQRAAAAAERQRIEDERIQAEARAKQLEAQREQERIAAEEALRAAQEEARLAAQQAERTRLATEEAARLAEQRRVEAEERAAREAEEAAQRHAEQVRLAEEETRAAIAKAKKDAEDAAKQHAANLEALRLKAEGEKRAADEQREREAAEAEERVRQERLKAIIAERERADAEYRATIAEADKREQDKAHKASVHDAAEAALIAGGMGKTAARMAVTIIARDQVPNIKISY
jgi:colicin import membrane protein